MLHRVDFINATSSRKVTAPIRRALLCLLHEDLEGRKAGIDVMIALDDRLQELNLQHRKVNAPTDVLSFPAPRNPAGQLGDIVISWDFAAKQAKQRKVKPVEEAAMLAVHGALHLLGMDDDTEPRRQAMVRRQNEIMLAVGLPTDKDWTSLPHEEPLK